MIAESSECAAYLLQKLRNRSNSALKPIVLDDLMPVDEIVA